MAGPSDSPTSSGAPVPADAPAPWDDLDPATRAQLFSAMLEASADVVILLDAAGTVLYANAAAGAAFGVAAGDRAADRLAAVLDRDAVDRALGRTGSADDTGAVWHGDVSTPDGARTFALSVQRHPVGPGTAGFLAVIAHDVTETKQVQAQLAHQASHDVLTGLANRVLFQELGEQALARAHRTGTVVAVLFVDLDRFKPVNDEFGHAVGDALLAEVAARLRASLRRGDVVARFGGDEFVVLCEHPAGKTEMGDLAGRLIAALSEPFTVAGTTVVVGASVGIAIGGGGRVTIDMLIRDADAALYRAKEGGRGRAVAFGDGG